MSFILITAGENLPTVPMLADVLVAALGLDRSTAALTARRCWGILGTGLDEAAADALAAHCAGFGVAAKKIQADALPTLPAPNHAKKVILENGQAIFSLPGGRIAAVSPGEISVLAAAPIKEEFTKTIKTTEGPSGGERAARLGIMVVTGLPIGMGKSKEVKKEIKSSELSFYMDIILRDGAERLRFTSGDFDFSGLKEKKIYSSQMNFRVMAAELAAFAPTAFKNAFLLAMLGGKPLTLLPYDSLADLEKETTHLLLARRG